MSDNRSTAPAAETAAPAVDENQLIAERREKLKALSESRQRIQTLYDGYLQKCRDAEQTLQSITVSQGYRGFLTQLQGLLNRVDVDIQTAQFAQD